MRGPTYIKRNIIFIFLFVILLFSTALQVPAGSPKKGFHPFHQYIDIEYDPSVFNQTFDIHKAINVPIKITYWTNVRENLLSFVRIFAPLKVNMIIYGKQFPQQRIYINVTDKPKWVEVKVVQGKVPVDIPAINTSRGYEGIPSADETFTFTSSIIISPLEEAPSKIYSIEIEITCPSMGLLKEAVFKKKITFRPRFLPKIQIKPDETVKIASPHEAVNFRIEVTNYANKKMRIQPELKGLPKRWDPTINPSFIDINASNGSSFYNGSFYFSVFVPYDFGWHDTAETFKINFTATSFPIDNNSITGGPYQISLTVNNYGFSLPGFEYTIVLIAMSMVLLSIKGRNKGES